MTIGILLRGENTIVQLEILGRADRLFPERAGRYYGGPITPDEVTALTAGLKLRAHDTA